MLFETRSSFFHGVEKPFRLDVMRPFKNIQVGGWAALPNIFCHGPALFAAINIFFFWCCADFQQRSNERLLVLPQTRSSSFHDVESTFRPDGMKLFKNIQNLDWIVLPQTRPSSYHGVEEIFGLDVMQPFPKHSSWCLGCGPQHPLSRPSSFRGVKHHFFFWCYAEFQQCSNERLVVLPQTRSSSFYRVKSTFRPDGVKFFKNIQNFDWIVLPQTRPCSFHGVEESFRLDVMQPFRKHSSWWLGRASQHPLSRPSLFRGVKHPFVLMLCRFSTTFKWTAGRVAPNTVQLISRC